MLSLQKDTTTGDAGSGVLKTDIKSAISLSDVLEALKLYLHKPVPEASPYKIMAADINQDGQVSLTDVLSLLKIYLGKPTADQPKWIFVDEAADLSAISTSHTQSTPPTVMAHPGKLTENFAAVLVGDVNGSWQPPVTQAYQVLTADHFNASELGLVGVSDANLQVQFGLA